MRLGTATMMRHGATEYSGVFPDLIDAGIPNIKASAADIRRRFPDTPLFVSSPADRAVATALHVRQAYGLGWDRDQVQTIGLLRPMTVIDPRPVIAHFETVTSNITDPHELHRVWDRFYMENEEFERGNFCETRSSSKQRFLQFIQEILPGLCKGGRHVVGVSHCELIATAMYEWFGGECFRPAEVAHFELYSSSHFLVEFRGEKRTVKL